MRRWTTWTVLVLVAVGAAIAADDDEARKGPLTVGAPAPDFRLNDHSGRALRLSEYGKESWTILAFFPKASTPG